MKIAHLDSHRAWRDGQQQVLYLTQFLLSHPDGQQQVLYLTQFLLSGHESVVVGQAGCALFRRARAAGVPATGLNMRHELDLVAAWQRGKWLRRQRVDILHMHEPHAHSIGLIASPMAPTVRKVVSRRVDFRPIRNLLSRYKYTMTDVRYLAVSEAVRKVMLVCGIAADAVHTVYCGIDLGRVDTIHQTSNVFPADSRVIGTVGHLSGHKGHRYLLRAMREVCEVERNARLVIVGEGRLRTGLEAEAAALGPGDAVYL